MRPSRQKQTRGPAVTLTDPACLACLMFEDGDPACPDHGGTFEEGMLCPTCGDDAVLVSQKGAAYICLNCDEEDDL
jgi:hypothetical protein